VGNACVADGFDAVDLQTSRTSPIDRDAAGDLYVRSMALMILKDPAATRQAAQAVAMNHGGEVIGAVPMVQLFQVRFASAVTTAELDAKISALAADPAVDSAIRETVHINPTVQAMRPAADTERLTSMAQYEDRLIQGTFNYIGPQGRWAYESIGVYKAWDAIFEANPQSVGVGTVIGVLDDYVQKAPVFNRLKFPNFTDIRAYGEFMEDPAHPPTHGNQVAAVIGAPHDGAGMNGIMSGLKCINYDLSPQAAIANWVLPDAGVPMNAFGFEGQKSVALGAVFMGVVQAVRAGARVVNMSFGSNYDGAQYDRAYATVAKLYRRLLAEAKHTLFVVAGRNDGGDDARALPVGASSGAANIISVDALMHDGVTRARWNKADGSPPDMVTPGKADIAAPGEDVLAQLPNGNLSMFLGCSSAAPVVSGVAGLMFAIHPEMTGAEAKTMLLETADAIPGPTTTGKRVNAEKAVKAALARFKELHPDLAPGTCRQDGNDCPVDSTCTACLTQMTLTVRPMGEAETTRQVQGELGVGWLLDGGIDFEHVSINQFDSQTPGLARFGFTVPYDFSGSTQATTRTDVRIVATNAGVSDVGFFSDGKNDPNTMLERSFYAARGELDFTVSGSVLTGSLLLSDGFGNQALVTFDGGYRPTFAQCPGEPP
jgi:subtilisin family serine protease